MKGLLPISLLILCLSVPVWTSYGSDIEGRVVITKKLSRKELRMPVYQLRGASSSRAEKHSEPSNDYSEVAVFLEGNLPQPEKHVQAELRQENQRFEPQMVLIPAGSTVSFPNADPIFHNVFSLSSTKRFDLGYYPEGQSRVVKFDQPGVVQVYCHLHTNMHAAIVVTPNHWYTLLDNDGNFALHGVPPGTYRLVAWHMNAGFFRREIQVGPAGANEIVIEIPVRDGEPSR